MRNTCIISISEYQTGGSCEAYVVDTEQENVENWLNKTGCYDVDFIASIRNRFSRIAIIKGLYVEEDSRHQGIGTSIFEKILDNAGLYDAKAIMLECDKGENNNFDIQKWYEDYEFEVVFQYTNPIMLMTLI